MNNIYHNFNWSRTPSLANISSVYIATPDDDSSTRISKDELIHSLFSYNKIEDLKRRHYLLRSVLINIAISIPFIVVLLNIFKGIS